MDSLFLKLLNMSISASWLVLAVVVLRFVLKKAPKSVRCVLWGLVGIRLICPVSFESVLSLIPSGETVPPEIVYARQPAIDSGVATIDRVVNPVIQSSFAPGSELTSVNPIQIGLFAVEIIWAIGMGVMMVYALVSYLRLRRKVSASVNPGENVWLCDYIDTPFVLGVFRPRIYLPSGMSDRDRMYVLAHERAHLKRRDHWWKPLGFALLTVYWFNPVMWVAYVLLCRDIELACDEKVIREMDVRDKKAYSQALLSCSVPRSMIAACPLAFGEVGVKERVRAVLNYRKPAFWLMIAAVIVCAAAAVCFLTDPVAESEPTDPLSLEATEETQVVGHRAGDIGSVGVGIGHKYANVYLRIPKGWVYEIVGEDSMSEFGVAFWPEGCDQGRVELVFMAEPLGLCGTGLETEEVTLSNGLTGSVGTYDDQPYWSYVSFFDTPGCYVAMTQSVESWWPEYGDQVLEILATAELGRGFIRKSEAIAAAEAAFGKPYNWADGTFDFETGIWEVWFYENVHDSSPGMTISVDAAGNVLDPMGWGVVLTAEDVTSTGMTLVCTRSDGIGELTTGRPFWLQQWNGSEWEAVPEVAEEVAWTTEAWVIPQDKTARWDVDWSYFYGQLPAGTYRMGKTLSCDMCKSDSLHDHQPYYAYFKIMDEEMGESGDNYVETWASEVVDGEVDYAISTRDEVYATIKATKDGKTVSKEFEMAGMIDRTGTMDIKGIGKVALVSYSGGEACIVQVYQLVDHEIQLLGTIDCGADMVKEAAYTVDTKNETTAVIKAKRNGETITNEFEMSAAIANTGVMDLFDYGKVVFVAETGGEYYAIQVYRLSQDYTTGKTKEIQNVGCIQLGGIQTTQQPFETGELGQDGKISFENYDFSDVTKVVFYHYLYPENSTVVTDPEDVKNICGFLQSIVGVNGGSSKGYYGGTYRVDLYSGEEMKDFFFFEGTGSDVFQYGYYDEHYRMRYEMDGMTGEEVDAFFAQLEKQ